MSESPAASLTASLLSHKGWAQPSLLAESDEPRGARVAKLPARSCANHRAGVGETGRAKLSLRLDAARHRRLKLACLETGKSAQMLILDLLDQHLEQRLGAVGNCPCLSAARAVDGDEERDPA